MVSEKGSDSDRQVKSFDQQGQKFEGAPAGDAADLSALGYKPELRRNRSMFTLLFQSLAIAAVSSSFIFLMLFLTFDRSPMALVHQ